MLNLIGVGTGILEKAVNSCNKSSDLELNASYNSLIKESTRNWYTYKVSISCCDCQNDISNRVVLIDGSLVISNEDGRAWVTNDIDGDGTHGGIRWVSWIVGLYTNSVLGQTV